MESTAVSTAVINLERQIVKSMYTYLGLFLGALARTFVPYLVKLKKKPNLKWENKYLTPALAGIVLSLIATLVLASEVNMDVGFLGAFTLAYTLHSLSRETQKIIK